MALEYLNMANVWRFRSFVCTILLLITVVILILSLGFDYNVNVYFRPLNDGENTEFRNFKIDEPTYILVKRSSDNPYPKKAVPLPEKKQSVRTTTTSPLFNKHDLFTSVKVSAAEHRNDEIFPTFPPNTSVTSEEGYHVYYNSSFYKKKELAEPLLIDFKKLPEENITVHQMLSDSYRRAATVSLSFDFPFYGHLLRNITIATGGFLYMEEYVHSWLAATQYVAPLMANFDTSIKNESLVRYSDNGTAFTVQWHQVFLQDREYDGPFTFQVTLMKDGRILFVYEKIPLSVTEIANHSHPVKVGISDAYTIDRTIYFIRRKTIYEYNRIDMRRDEIGNYTAIVFNPLPTCLSFNDCESCMTSKTDFACVWCDQVQRCSDGLDRHRQEWLKQNCSSEKEEMKCSDMGFSKHSESFDNTDLGINKTIDTYSTKNTVKSETTSLPLIVSSMEPKYKPFTPTNVVLDDHDKSTSAQVGERGDNDSSIGIGGVIAILVILILIFGIGIWVVYAYRFPQTPSGQFLIKYRPSQWRFRHGEARYTAASIHM